MLDTVKGHGEEAFFFENEGRQLYGVLHSTGDPDTAKGGLIICQPAGEEMHYTRRTLANFARSACEQGYYVFRFDYGGCGDSEGEPWDVTLSSQLSDINRAVELMADSGIQKIGLLGVRVGGALAVLAAKDNPGIEFLILWSPVLNLKEYFDGQYRSDLIADAWIIGKGVNTQGTLEEVLKAEGHFEMRLYYMTEKAYAEYARVDCTESLNDFERELFLAEVAHDDKRVKGMTRRLESLYGGSNERRQCRVVQEYDFWTSTFVYQGMTPRRLCNETLDWLANRP